MADLKTNLAEHWQELIQRCGFTVSIDENGVFMSENCMNGRIFHEPDGISALSAIHLEVIEECSERVATLTATLAERDKKIDSLTALAELFVKQRDAAEVNAMSLAGGNATLSKDLAERDAAKEKIAPVQGFSAGIPWSMHLRAYDAYCKEYGPQQALIDLEGRNCRGGFGTNELDKFIPEWRTELSELAQLKRQLAERDATIKRLSAPVSDKEWSINHWKESGGSMRGFVDGFVAARLQGTKGDAK
jgi:hypothetical protein